MTQEKDKNPGGYADEQTEQDSVNLAAPCGQVPSAYEGQSPLDALRAFAQDVMRDWPESLGCDGFDLQDLAEKHGLLRLKTPKPTQPCLEEGCSCASYYSPEEFAEGVDCFERTELLTGRPTVNALAAPAHEARPDHPCTSAKVTDHAADDARDAALPEEYVLAGWQAALRCHALHGMAGWSMHGEEFRGAALRQHRREP